MSDCVELELRQWTSPMGRNNVYIHKTTLGFLKTLYARCTNLYTYYIYSIYFQVERPI